MSLANELERLSEMRDQGVLTDEEFQAAKREALRVGPRPATTPQVVSPATTRTNGLAVASLVLGLIGMGVGHVLGLVFGYRAKAQIDSSRGRESGRGLAIAGIVLGWIGLATLTILLLAVGVTAFRDAQDGRYGLRGAPMPANCEIGTFYWGNEPMGVNKGGVDVHCFWPGARGATSGAIDHVRHWMRDNGFDDEGHNLDVGYVVLGFSEPPD